MKIVEAVKMRRFLRLWKLTANCAEMSRFASRSLEEPLTLLMPFKRGLDFLICLWCERYFRQLKFLQGAGPGVGERNESVPDHGLPLQPGRASGSGSKSRELKAGKDFVRPPTNMQRQSELRPHAEGTGSVIWIRGWKFK